MAKWLSAWGGGGGRGQILLFIDMSLCGPIQQQQLGMAMTGQQGGAAAPGGGSGTMGGTHGQTTTQQQTQAMGNVNRPPGMKNCFILHHGFTTSVH